MAEKDNMKVNTSPVADVETGTAEDVEAIMKKYDRESNTRIWEGTPKQVIRFLLAAFSVLMLYMNLFANWDERVRRSLFVGFVIILSFLVYPMKKGSSKKNSVPIYDIILMVLGAGAYFYFVFNFKTIIGHATRISQTEVIVGVIGILILAETCRRVVGIPILCVATFFVGYAFYNGLGQGRAFAVVLKSIVYNLFYTTSGVIGTPIGVCSTYIALFILFGAFLEATGISEFFIQLANSLAGASTGGPAKVAVISSALCGMVSGSSVGNTVTTGSVTIPLMKKTGYQGEFAGAVEAASSTGGQIMPPIMGAAAFLMAEMVGVQYGEIAMRAIFPALLYFTGIFITVHLEAKRLGLKGIPKDELPKFGPLFVRQGYLLIPLVALVAMVMMGYTMSRAAIIATALAILVSMPNKETRMNPTRFINALEAGGKNTLSVAVACGVAGIIAGVVTMTGLGQLLISAIVGVAGDRVERRRDERLHDARVHGEVFIEARFGVLVPLFELGQGVGLLLLVVAADLVEQLLEGVGAVHALFAGLGRVRVERGHLLLQRVDAVERHLRREVDGAVRRRHAGDGVEVVCVGHRDDGAFRLAAGLVARAFGSARAFVAEAQAALVEQHEAGAPGRRFPRAGLYVWEHREDAASTFSYVIYDTIHKEELKTWILH